MVEHVRWIFSILVVHLISDQKWCAAKLPAIKCQLYDVIEETDPFKRIMEPAFRRTKKCVGGIQQPSRYQCQPSRTEEKKITLFDTHKSKYVQHTMVVPVACEEYCICRTGCPGKKLHKGICESGMTWDPNSCSCKCSMKGPSSGAHNKKVKTAGVTMEHHLITLGVLAIIFLAILFVVLMCYIRTKAKQSHKYRFLHKVTWNLDTKKKLKKHRDYIDGKKPEEKKTWKTFCCCRREDNEEQTALRVFDQTDAGSRYDLVTPLECFDIGYYAYKKDNFAEMLGWLKATEGKIERREEGFEHVRMDQLFEYLSLAYFLADDSDNAAMYKELAVRKTRSGLNGQAAGAIEEASSVSVGINGRAGGAVEEGSNSSTISNANENTETS